MKSPLVFLFILLLCSELRFEAVVGEDKHVCDEASGLCKDGYKPINCPGEECEVDKDSVVRPLNVFCDLIAETGNIDGYPVTCTSQYTIENGQATIEFRYCPPCPDPDATTKPKITTTTIPPKPSPPDIPTKPDANSTNLGDVDHNNCVGHICDDDDDGSGGGSRRPKRRAQPTDLAGCKGRLGDLLDEISNTWPFTIRETSGITFRPLRCLDAEHAASSLYHALLWESRYDLIQNRNSTPGFGAYWLIKRPVLGAYYFDEAWYVPDENVEIQSVISTLKSVLTFLFLA